MIDPPRLWVETKEREPIRSGYEVVTTPEAWPGFVRHLYISGAVLRELAELWQAEAARIGYEPGFQLESCANELERIIGGAK